MWGSPPWHYLKQRIGPLISAAQVDNEVVELTDALPETREGDVLVALGGEAMKLLAMAKVVPKGRSINSLRNRPFPMPGGGYALITYSTSILDVDYGKFVDLQTDVVAACRFVKTGEFAPRLGKYRYVNDFSEAIAWISAQKTPVLVTLDTETIGLDPYALEGRIESIQITYKKGAADVVRFRSHQECERVNDTIGDGLKGLWHQIQWLLTSDKVRMRGANLKYDMNWMAKHWGITNCTNYNFDSTIVGSILDENRSNSLTVHAKLFSDIGGYDDAFNQKYDKSRMDAVPDDDFLTYAGGDTDACYQASERMKEDLLKDKKLFTFYDKILHPAARAYEQVERVGWCVDVPYYRDLRDEIETDIRRLTRDAKEVLGGRLVAKHTKKDGTLNLGKARLLIDFFFSPNYLGLKPQMWTAGGEDGSKKAPSTAMEHLLKFKDHPKAGPMVAILSEYTSATKTLGTYVTGFLSHLREDGRWHPNYFLFSGMDEVETEGGAVTGRLSVKDPAIQTIPKHTKWAKRLRRAVIAPPGYLILSNDYSQGELKIAACLANEETMIDAYLHGIDLHAVTASRLAGYDFDDFMALAEADPHKWEEIRYLGKAGNFGLIYGMGANGFMIYAISNYGVVMTLEEAEVNRDAFFELYPGLIQWHKAYKAKARKQGFIRSPLGRIRHLPMLHSREEAVVAKELRRAINSPVQATLSDMALWSTGLMRTHGQFDVAPVFGMVHDQLLSYVPEDNWEAIAKERKELMENLPFEQVGWTPQLRFTVDTEIGPNLGELKKFKALCG
jgi:DNA polymerase I-like protein with 3'-5' exonuclease and polymerase domains